MKFSALANITSTKMDLSSNSNYPPTPPHLSACPATPTRPTIFKSNPGSPVATGDSSNDGRLSNDSDNTEGRGSPPPNCAICLYKCTNKCFTDSCLHQFCFTCLLQWSKVKPECPLCKQSFKSIIHNVRSNDDYEEYLVRPTITTIAEPLLISNYHLPHADRIGQRYRFRTTFNIQRREEMALQNYFMEHPLTNNFVLSPNPFYDISSSQHRHSFTRRSRHRNTGSGNGDFRTAVYHNNLWATPLPDITGRFRECTAHFYRNNPAQKHRLFPWLDRELKAILNQNQPHVNYVMSIISDLIPVHDITSAGFRTAVQPYFTDKTDHFIHEFYQFARSPFDMVGYDRDVQYVSHEYYMETLPNVISSTSDTDDSDVRIISPDINQARGSNSNNDDSVIYVNDESTSVMLTSEPAGLDLSLPRSNQIDTLVSIETISPSSSDDDSDACVITGVVKPPQDRTPEMVTLDSENEEAVVLSDCSDRSQSNASRLSFSSGEVYAPQLGMPSTSKAWSSKRSKSAVLQNNKKYSSANDSSSDSESDSNLPLIAHQRPMSEILLKRFQSAEKSKVENESSHSSSNEIDQSEKKRFNTRKGKCLVRNIASKKSTSKRCDVKRRKLSSSISESETNSSDNSNLAKNCKLKSVVIKKVEDESLSNCPFGDSTVFNESVENFNYTVGSSYYNNPLTSLSENSSETLDITSTDITSEKSRFTPEPFPSETANPFLGMFE